MFTKNLAELRIAKRILKKKIKKESRIGELTLLNCKTYYKTVESRQCGTGKKGDI